MSPPSGWSPKARARRGPGTARVPPETAKRVSMMSKIDVNFIGEIIGIQRPAPKCDDGCKIEIVMAKVVKGT